MIPQEEIEKVKRRFGIIGNSKYLNRAVEVAAIVASTDLSVLITGENGSGKESFSKIIHGLSSRSNAKFIAINCGAIPEGTVDSELFGHKKGSFTGAIDDRKGYFEEADSGTIFLDEIGELPLPTQARLLRVLEYGELIKVGTSKVQKVDLRVVAATNVDLSHAIQKGKFREDLFYRLNTVPIKVPPLRERSSDIPLLFAKFANDFADKYRAVPVSLESGAQLALVQYEFPGNIRQLKNLVEQISILEQERSVSKKVLEEYLSQNPRSTPSLYSEARLSSEVQEREFIYKMIFQLKHELDSIKGILSKSKPEESLGIESEEGQSENLVHGLHLATKNCDNLLKPVENLYEEVKAKECITTAVNDLEEEEKLSINEKEKELIMKSLKRHKGNRKLAAVSLGISERTLYRKIREYEIE